LGSDELFSTGARFLPMQVRDVREVPRSIGAFRHQIPEYRRAEEKIPQIPVGVRMDFFDFAAFKALARAMGAAPGIRFSKGWAVYREHCGVCYVLTLGAKLSVKGIR
jgi:hypothetical protein